MKDSHLKIPWRFIPRALFITLLGYVMYALVELFLQNPYKAYVLVAPFCTLSGYRFFRAYLKHSRLSSFVYALIIGLFHPVVLPILGVFVIQPDALKDWNTMVITHYPKDSHDEEPPFPS